MSNSPSPLVSANGEDAANSNTRRMIAALSEVWQYRELFYFLAQRGLTLRYQRTILGLLDWALLGNSLAITVVLLLASIVYFHAVDRDPSDYV